VIRRIARVLLLLGFPLSLSLAPLAAHSEEIVVTAQKRMEYAPAPPSIPKPAVTVAKTADFLVQSVRLLNDSRDSTLRTREVFESIEALMKQATARSGIELSYGEGFLRPIDLDDEELQLQSDYDRADSGFLDIYVKVRFACNGNAPACPSSRSTFPTRFGSADAPADGSAGARAKGGDRELVAQGAPR